MLGRLETKSINPTNRAKLQGMKVISTHEAETHFSQLLEQVKAGAEIIIGENGQPSAKMKSWKRLGLSGFGEDSRLPKGLG